MEAKKIYSKAFRDEVLQAYFTGNDSSSSLSARYSVRAGTIQVWAQRYRKDYAHLISGSVSSDPVAVVDIGEFSSRHPKTVKGMEARLAELEKALSYERMRSRTYEKLIEIAERDLQISIKKKSGAKQ
ncbi:hypothetical protein [Bacteroides timonensis]|uniref:hypothetical protein n=1 Tax=Bacteroides timonensis TaxID=1470345 RepID=UPI0005C71E6F|nr:hypothetical protein [Bacteroides timonensis]